MYVPALRDRPALELGQPNYQHPRRAAGDYGPWLDRFSARVIHLSLAALATDPGLWARLHKPGGEYLPAAEVRLEDLADSDSLTALGSVGPVLRAQAAELAELVRRPLDAIPPLDRTPGRRVASEEKQSAAANAVGIAPAPGSWIDDHLPLPEPVTLDRPPRRPPCRVLLESRAPRRGRCCDLRRPADRFRRSARGCRRGWAGGCRAALANQVRATAPGTGAAGPAQGVQCGPRPAQAGRDAAQTGSSPPGR